jgi:hypothetical protein
MALRTRVVLVALLIIAVFIGADQIKVELARLDVEKTLYVDLPPSTALDAAMDYLRLRSYFPHYLTAPNVIDAVRGIDTPIAPSAIERRFFIRGYLDDQRRIARWEVHAERVFIPLP